MATSDNQALLLQVSADIRGLEKAFAKASGTVDRESGFMERRAKQLGRNIESAKGLTGEGLGKAISKVFDSTRLAVLEEGSSKLRLFGSALEPLGAAGLAAAAAITTIGVAAEQARKAMEWADDLDRTSKALGVTTDSLQKYDYAAVASSIGIAKGREVLSEFNGEIGKFETHTGDKRLVKWADNIKLSRDEINRTIDPVEKLALVMEKISKLSDVQSRTSAAKAFGLDGLLPIINGGSRSIEEFIGKMKEAQTVGGVINAEDVKRAAEMNDKVEALTYLIGQHFKAAFIEVAPAIEKVAEFLELCTRNLGEFLNAIPQAIRGIESLLEKLPHLPTVNAAPGVVEGAARAAGLGTGIDAARAAKSALDGLAAQGRFANLQGKVRNLAAGGKIDLSGTEYDPLLANQGAGKQLQFDKPTKSRSGPQNQTENLDAAALQALDGAQRAALQALIKLAETIQQRAAYEQQVLDAEQKGKLDELAKKEGEIRRSKNDSHKAEQLALIEKAKVEVHNTYLANSEALARQTAVDLLKQSEDQAQAVARRQADTLDAYQAHQTAMSALAHTYEGRTAFERAALLAAQARENVLAQAEVDRAQSELDIAKANKRQEDIINAQNALDAAKQHQSDLGQAHTDQAAIFNDTHGGPLKDYVNSIGDVNTAFQNLEANGISSLIDGLASAGAGATKLGDVFRNVIQQMAIDANKILLQSLVSGAMGGAVSGGGGKGVLGFLGGIFGSLKGGGLTADLKAAAVANPMLFADGTDAAPRGWSIVGERGPELRFMGGGEKIVPNDILRAIVKTPQQASGVRSGAIVEHLHITVPGTGSVVDARRTARQVHAELQRLGANARGAGF